MIITDNTIERIKKALRQGAVLVVYHYACREEWTEETRIFLYRRNQLLQLEWVGWDHTLGLDKLLDLTKELRYIPSRNIPHVIVDECHDWKVKGHLSYDIELYKL